MYGFINPFHDSKMKLFEVKRLRIGIKAFLLVAMVAFSFARAHAADDFKVLKIDPDEKAAVVKTSDGALKIIRQGDELEPHGQIISISTGCLVFRNNKAEKTILTLTNGKQTIQRTGKINTAPRKSVVTITTSTGTDKGAAHETGVEKSKRTKDKK